LVVEAPHRRSNLLSYARVPWRSFDGRPGPRGLDPSYKAKITGAPQ
jgi:hypothetical protein